MVNNNANQNVRVCIVTISLGKGGAERSTAILSTMLSHIGFDVTIITLTNLIDYTYSGTLFNLGLYKKDPDRPVARFKRFRKLRRYIQEQKFDVIIDNRAKQLWQKELLYFKYIYPGQKLIYVTRNYKKETFLSKKDWMTRKMIRRTKKIIAVSKEIADAMNSRYNTTHFHPIYNPIEPLPIEKPENWNIEQPFVLFLGRMEDKAKNIVLLLDSYSQSELPSLNVPLVLLGEGKDVPLIAKRANELQITDMVIHHDYTPQVGWYLHKAKFLILSSRHEGFPRVLIEALSVGTPVVSVDCKSGPKEVVQHEKNGLLVPNHNPEKLAKAISRMYTDKQLYNQCKAFAKESVQHLSIENISKQWEEQILEAIKE
ncbi:MAG TPA: glycosyltransferase [Flavobacteriaceae bacterium]|nr:glycosyltransferase [Flavobacteriaceae bacterium]